MDSSKDLINASISGIGLLYKVAYDMLGTRYKVKSYESMSSDKEGEVGIFLYDAGNDLLTLDGDITYKQVKLHVQVNSYKSDNGFFDALNYLENFVDVIENNQPHIEGIKFIEVVHNGMKARQFGKNEHNIHQCACNILIKYI